MTVPHARFDLFVIASALIAGSAAVTTASSAAEPFAFSSAPVDGSELAEIAGGADLSLAALAEQSGAVTNNSVNGNSVTGTINLDGQAFQNMNGLAVVSANTGNNVSINSTMQVNISIGAAP